MRVKNPHQQKLIWRRFKSRWRHHGLKMHGEEPWLLPIFSLWCLHLLCFMGNTILLHEKYQEYMHILRYIVYQECYLIVC